MEKFYLECWIPSLSGYQKISELKTKQLDVLSKNLINNNNIEINNLFNTIIYNNLANKDLFSVLTKFDKWFILCFLRSVNISDSLIYHTQTGNIEFSLSKILSDLSEIKHPTVDSLLINNIEFELRPGNNLFIENILYNIESIKIDDNKTLISESNKNQFIVGLSKEITDVLTKFLYVCDSRVNAFILENKIQLPDFKTVPFRIYDNTLFYFLKSIFQPYAQGLYRKKYLLINKIGFQYNDLDELTPAECDIFINLYFAEEKEKKSSKPNNIQ